MRLLQRALSDLFNLFFRDLTDPERLWPWWQLRLYGSFIGLMVLALARQG